MSIFDKRTLIKPYEYPESLDFMRAVRHSQWFIDEYKESLIRDVSDFHNKLSEKEKTVVTRSLLAISQIEVAVKTFWGKLYDNLPKSEFGMVGFTFAHNEIVHMEAYSELLDKLGLNHMFIELLEVPEIKGRIEYLTKYLKGVADNSKERYTLSLILFSVFVESVSLFSQFYIIKSFCQKKQLLKSVDNIVMSTAKEEDIHFQFGAYLINVIKKENPEWFNDDFLAKVYRACNKALQAEIKIVEWIFDSEDLDFVTREEVTEFIKNRFNTSLEHIGLNKIFDINQDILNHSKWFEYERVLDVRVDFFDLQSPNYTSGDQEITADSLFD
jgi:ribonucleoside-diphosphate reductase beta chain